jgi:hypothetical protein
MLHRYEGRCLVEHFFTRIQCIGRRSCAGTTPVTFLDLVLLTARCFLLR